jgi:hypothetical protein
MSRMQDLIDVCSHTFHGVPQLDIPDSKDLNVEKFYISMIQHASECVRDVLRTDGTTLTYEAADEIQKRLKEFFEVSW